MAKASQRLLRYGSNRLWATPVTLGNLLEEGVVEEKLHKWLEEYANDPRLVFGPPSDLDKSEKRYSRIDITLFAPPASRQLARIKEILIGRADRYARETIMNPLPDHEKHATFWFVIQHPKNLNDPLMPHFHEGSDVGLVYYLSTPSNGSGGIMMVDPRGLIARGGQAFPKHKPAIQFHPRRGDLLILPRYVLHYTNVNTDARDRKAIAGVVKYDLPRAEALRFLVRPGKGGMRNSASKFPR